MSDEYEYGPWVEVPPGSTLELDWGDGAKLWRTTHSLPSRIRLATPKPKRELVVGKWYRDMSGDWRKCIAIENSRAWLLMQGGDSAWPWTMDGREPGMKNAAPEDIDWSTPPRDEAPNE